MKPGRVVLNILLVLAAAVFVQQIPDIVRYMKIRSM